MNVIITGTASGIGKAAAGKFLQEGWDVWGVDVKESAIRHPRYRHFTRDIPGSGSRTGVFDPLCGHGRLPSFGTEFPGRLYDNGHDADRQ